MVVEGPKSGLRGNITARERWDRCWLRLCCEALGSVAIAEQRIMGEGLGKPVGDSVFRRTEVPEFKVCKSRWRHGISTHWQACFVPRLAKAQFLAYTSIIQRGHIGEDTRLPGLVFMSTETPPCQSPSHRYIVIYVPMHGEAQASMKHSMRRARSRMTSDGVER